MSRSNPGPLRLRKASKQRKAGPPYLSVQHLCERGVQTDGPAVQEQPVGILPAEAQADGVGPGLPADAEVRDELPHGAVLSHRGEDV